MNFLNAKSKTRENPKYDKCSLFTTKIPHSFPLTQFKSSPNFKVLKLFTVRIQSKSTKIRYGPDPV